MSRAPVLPALDACVAEPGLLAGLGRVGVVTNQAATTLDFVPAIEAIRAACRDTSGSRVVSVFGPQHGYGQTEQDNMFETPDGVFTCADGERLPLWSLYSETRVPLPHQLDGVDTLVVDLVDIGCRIYTYMLTLAGCLRAAAAQGKRVVVLDRPNPLGLSYRDGASGNWRRVEGNLLDLRWQSFVGWYAIPMRHGLTMGELGRVFLAQDALEVDYRVVPVRGLVRELPARCGEQLFTALPSPNMPS